MPTIKTKKEMNLSELIEWAIKKDIKDEKFYSKNGCHISIDFRGHVFLWDIRLNEIFTVEIEEEITEDTVFKQLIEASEDDLFVIENGSINTERDNLSESFYAYINGEIILIWTKEKGLV